MPHHPVYGLDIETGHPTGHDTASGSGRDDGPAVDPRRTIVVRAVLATPAGDQVFDGDEPRLMQDLDLALARARPGILATWNGSGFVLPYLADRAGIRGIHLGLRLAADPRRRHRGETLPGHRCAYRAAWYEHRHLDVAGLYRSGRRPLIEVDELLRAIGLAGRGRGSRGIGPADVPGCELTHDAAHAFATNDARLVRSLVEARLPGVARHLDRIVPVAAAPEPPVAAVPRRTSIGGIPLSPAHPAVRAALAANER